MFLCLILKYNILLHFKNNSIICLLLHSCHCGNCLMQLIFVGIFAIRSIIFSTSKCKKWKINKIIHFQYAMELTYQLSCVSSITWFFQMITQVWGLFMVCAKRSKYNVNKCGRVTIFMQLFIFFWQMVEKSWSVFHDNWILSRNSTIANIHSM